MTDNDNNSTAISPFLTEMASCPDQIQEGMIQELLSEYAPLTYEEMYRILGYELHDRKRQVGQPFLSEAEIEDYMLLLQRIIDYRMDKLRARPKSHAGHELGAREFTLTYSPKWFDDSEARVRMMKAIDKLCKYYEHDILELRAVGEVGSNGLSHVHCFYKLRGGLKITDKNFKRAYPNWNPKKKIGHGFEGGHHANVKEEADFRGYIDKDVDVAWMEKNIRNI